MKKIMFLGGSLQQVPAIEKAKEMGLYVITVDYLPSNPGHKIADEYFNVSTTDLDGVLDIAKKCKIDGIVAYASDPAAPTAAYVSEKLHLPGNPYESVNLLTRKDLFREFLRKNNLNCPKAESFFTFNEAYQYVRTSDFPLMVKPVDSSGSKGVVKINSLNEFENAFNEAKTYSRCGKIIVEDFIVKRGYQISGDAFSVDGKLVFSSYGNELYCNNGLRNYVAMGEFWPSLLTKEEKQLVDDELQKIITALGMKTSAYNVEAIIDENNKVYILELGPRNGGSYIPQLIKLATGVDLIDYTIKGALGFDCSSLAMAETKKCVSNYMIYSHKDGIFDGFIIDKKFEKHLLNIYCTAKIGDRIHRYQNTSHSLGTIIFECDNLDEMETTANNIDTYFKVKTR